MGIIEIDLCIYKYVDYYVFQNFLVFKYMTCKNVNTFTAWLKVKQLHVS